MRYWLAPPVPRRPPLALLALSVAAGATGCNDAREPASARTSTAMIAAAPSGSMGAEAHLKVEVAYENGTFRLVRATRVPFPLHRRRGEPPARGLHFVARQGGATVHVGLIPDLRSRHAEWTDPATGQLQGKEAPTEGAQHFLLEVPLGTELVDLHDAAVTAAPPPSNQVKGPGQQPIGTLDLRTLP